MSSGPELTVVVVDDEQLARDELCFMLEEMGGVSILARAGNGEEALALVERLEPQVVFLDVQMPRLNGLQATRRIRAAMALRRRPADRTRPRRKRASAHRATVDPRSR